MQLPVSKAAVRRRCPLLSHRISPNVNVSGIQKTVKTSATNSFTVSFYGLGKNLEYF